MSFQIDCPDCGKRPVWEFHYGGPVKTRPAPDAPVDAWTDYIFNQPNVRGVQVEWWYHRSGCKGWFLAERDTRINQVLTTRRYVPSPHTPLPQGEGPGVRVEPPGEPVEVPRPVESSE